MQQATRATQPYRRGTGLRLPGPTLDAMLKGAPTYLPHPMSVQRALERSVGTVLTANALADALRRGGR